MRAGLRFKGILEALTLPVIHLPYLSQVTLASRHNMKNALRAVLVMDVPDAAQRPCICRSLPRVELI